MMAVDTDHGNAGYGDDLKIPITSSKTVRDSDDCIKNVKNLARLEVLASLPANRGVFGVEALVRPTA